MNINNINDAGKPLIPRRPADREQDAPVVKPGQAEQPAEADIARAQLQPAENVETVSTVSDRDAYRASTSQRRIEELTTLVENMGEEPREDRIAQARKRVAAGYYNTEDVAGQLAMRLINTEPTNG